MRDEKEKYTYEYWFKNEFHKSWDNGGEKYYANYFFEDIIFNLEIPDEGFIVVLGTYKCVSFQKLCDKYGADRCIGYDLHNPSNHPRVIIKDGITLGSEDNIPIAFCHNDFGGFQHTPKLKMHGQRWAAKNMVSGGVFLGNSNQNSLNLDIEKIMTDLNFKNTILADLPKETADLSRLPEYRHYSYMISRKF